MNHLVKFWIEDSLPFVADGCFSKKIRLTSGRQSSQQVGQVKSVCRRDIESKGLYISAEFGDEFKRKLLISLNLDLEAL